MKNKKRALSIAVATALIVSNPLAMTGCTKQNPTIGYVQEKEEEEEEQSGGGSSSWWHFNRSGTGSSSIKSKSSSFWSNLGKSLSGGYSSARGGSTSS